MAALIATLWAYDGWNDLTMVAGEVRRPERSLPIALIGGLVIVGALFMATNAAIQYVLPAGEHRPERATGRIRADGGGGRAGSGLCGRGHGAEHLCNAERNHHVGRAHSLRGGARRPVLSPVRACRSALPVALDVTHRAGADFDRAAPFLSQFQQHFELAVFAEWLFYMLTATTIFVYRKKHPEMARPYRMWGYPALPAVFVVCAAAVLVSSFASNLEGSLIGTGLIVAGLPVLWVVRRMYGVRT